MQPLLSAQALGISPQLVSNVQAPGAFAKCTVMAGIDIAPDDSGLMTYNNVTGQQSSAAICIYERYGDTLVL